MGNSSLYEIVDPSEVHNDDYELVSAPQDKQAPQVMEDLGQSSSNNALDTIGRSVNRGMLHLSSLLAKSPTLSHALQSTTAATQPFNKDVQKTGVQNIAAGITQGGINSYISAANLLSKMTGMGFHVPEVDLSKYTDEQGIGNLGFQGGNITGELLAPAGILSKLKPLGKLSGYKNIALNAAKGAGVGYATGEYNPGGRAVSAAFGIPIVGASGFSDKAIANTILKDKQDLIKAYSKGYDSIFNDAKKIGDGNVEVKTTLPGADIVKANDAKKYSKSLDKFSKIPTLENAHKAQSDMGKFVRYYEKVQAPSSEQISAMRTAENLQKRLRGGMYQAMKKSGDTTLTNRYGLLTKGYAEDVVPYKSSKDLTAYGKKKLSASKLINSLANNKGNSEFMESVGNKYPQLKNKALLKKVSDTIAKAAVGSALTVAGLKSTHTYGEE